MICRSRHSSRTGAARRFLCAALLAGCALFGVPAKGIAQQGLGLSGGFALPDIPVLTIEPDRLFAGTLFGKRLSKELEVQGSQLATENRRIEAELADEESELTALRGTMEASEFRALADAFDVKVTSARSAQDEKARALSQQSERAQRGFLQAIAPILEEMMIENGASVIMDRRAVFLSADASDITAAAIARIDEKLADGTALQDLLPETEAPAAPPEQ